MRAVHWLRCDTCQVIYQDVEIEYDPKTCGRDLPLPPCNCGADLVIDFSHGQAPEVKLFAPRVFAPGVVAETKLEAEVLLADMEARFGEKVEFDYRSEADAKRSADEKRHEGWKMRKERGVDQQTLEHQAKLRDVAEREAAKEALRNNQDPGTAAKQAASQVPTADALGQSSAPAPLLQQKGVVKSAKMLTGADLLGG